MSLRSFLGSKAKAVTGSSSSLSFQNEPQILEDAMQATLLIMNDDIDGANAGLSKGDSTFHRLGAGVVIFLRATLGFEREVMDEAAKKLDTCESSAARDQSQAQRHPENSRSSVYSPGAEYGLCLAEAQLMSAVMHVLNESLTEAIKGFYKLRKAYITLDAIMAEEKRFLAKKGVTDGTPSSSKLSLPSTTSTHRTGPTPTVPSTPATGSTVSVDSLSKNTASISLDTNNDEDSDDDFVDAEEMHEGMPPPTTYQGHLAKGTNGNSTKSVPQPAPSSSLAESGPDVSHFNENPIDLFIHSGSNLCFGVLLLIISLVPPAFAVLLKIVGFKGDRERGINMLWQASRAGNINGAFAGLVVLGYHNAIMGSCDIVAQQGDGSYPRERCTALLKEMRTRFPESRLWMMEEARMIAGQGGLEEAVQMLDGQSKSPLKQVEALQCFEKSLNAMYMHDYEKCSASFQKCVTLNNWSHALYYYIAGACHVELYRLAKPSNPTLAAEHAQKAEELLKLVPKHTGKKRFMAKQLPFDVFSTRKIEKWQQRADAWGCSFVDAVGVSPVEEMILFWNGYKRMRARHLEVSMKRLYWSDGGENRTWEREDLDEKALLALLRASTLRSLKRFDEARVILKNSVLCHDWATYKAIGPKADAWPCPVAHYEMAVICWMEFVGGGEADRKSLEECKVWVDKVAAWEGYDLDARFGIRITTAKETLKKYGLTFA